MTGIVYTSGTDTPQHVQKGMSIEVRVGGIFCGTFYIDGRRGTAGETHTVQCQNAPIPVTPGSTYLTLQANLNNKGCNGCGGKNYLMIGEVTMF